MVDEKYNKDHCADCERRCGDCQDGFKKQGGNKRGNSIFGKVQVYDPEGFHVMRYAQHNALEALMGLFHKQGAA